MASDPDQVSTKTLVDTKRELLSVGRRREWQEALKRQMVAETLQQVSGWLNRRGFSNRVG